MTDPREIEIETAGQAQRMLTVNGFVPLAEAARVTGIPLSTLADAVRSGRLPAVRVQPRRWLVRISAVRLAISPKKVAHENEIERQLAQHGIVADRSHAPAPKRLPPITPVELPGKPVSEIVLEERR
jgi:excisionase family DNA binding protein